MSEKIKNISIMGSTGSIGTQTIDVVQANPTRFRVCALTARKNWELLARQALRFHPELVVIADEEYLPQLRQALAGTGIRVEAGHQALSEAATLPDVDIVVGALVGFSGLQSCVDAIKAGRTLALANKETLVVAGEIIDSLLKEAGTRILPVDSEHSAIFQCLQGESPEDVENLILTASGGPFRNATREIMENATIADALNHPNWDMGSKVTIDSATMMNKGFEMIEARWLFGVTPDRIRILVHPQSIVHSMVEFRDGSLKAQIGSPDMRIPIAYALSYPNRLKGFQESRITLSSLSSLTFERPDYDRFPLLKAAFEAINSGGTRPAILNAANEVAVASFLNRKIGFTDIFDVVITTLEKMAWEKTATLENIFETHREALNFATEIVNSIKK